MRVSLSERQCVAISTVIRGTGNTLQFAVAQITDEGVEEGRGRCHVWAPAYRDQMWKLFLFPDAAFA